MADTPSPPEFGPGRVVLIRHGQTEWSATGRHTSYTDLDLTPEGEIQARAIPYLLDGLGIRPVVVFCSPRHRSRRTAELAGLHVDGVLDDLAEWSYGEYEGLTSKEIHQTRPGWSIFASGAPGGESPEQVEARADRALAVARERTADGDVLLIGHGHMSRVLSARWIGLPASHGGNLAMHPAAVTVLGTYHDAPALDHVNVVPFALRELGGT
jgi:probable phosphoglycerate mutase